MGQVGDFAQQQQVVAAKRAGRTPLAFLMVEPLEGHVVAQAGLGLVLPDGCFDAAEADLMHRLVSGGRCGCG